MSDQINDVVYQTLKKEGHAGENRNEKMTSWLKSEGALGEDLMGLWKSFFNIKAILQGPHADRMESWLAINGYSDPRADSWLEYWAARFLLP